MKQPNADIQEQGDGLCCVGDIRRAHLLGALCVVSKD